MAYKHFLLILSTASLIGISGCDVSSGGGGGDSQEPDPVVVDFPIAYIERPIPRDEEGEFIPDNMLDLIAFKPGARLLLKDRASVPADSMVITDIAFAAQQSEEAMEDAETPAEDTPLYDVKDLSVNAEGTRLLFAMRAPEIPDADEEDQPTWNIWEYDLETEILRRIIESDTIAEEGQDIMPAYLADGSIVFSSNRQRRSRAVLLDENKPQFAALTEDGEETETFLLHVMDEFGSEIKQITFNQSHDLYPTLLEDGRIMFLRWDNYHGDKDRLSLYTANPNGSMVSLEYGFHSQMTGSNATEGVFSKPRELLDNKIQVTLRPRISEILGGGMIAIDTQNFTELNVDASGSGAAGPAQSSLVEGNISTDGSPSLAGYFSSVYPINEVDERLLVSWSPCQLFGFKLGIFVDDALQLINENGAFVNREGTPSSDPVVIEQDEVGVFPCTETAISQSNIQPAPPVYGLWLFDPLEQEQAPVVLSQQETMFTEALVIQTRPLPNFIGDPIPGIDFDAELEAENVGIVHIRSVYDVDGNDSSPNGISATADPLQTPEDQRPARFIRIVKAVSTASDDVVDFDGDAFGVARNHMKDILGYVPIEPDGSAMFKVPADVAFSFSILDGKGKRINPDGSGEPGQRHEYWMALRAGEVRECSGCHADGETETPHGRYNAEPESINMGALAAAPFANTQLRDEFGTPHITPEVGETMAQYFSRLNGPRTPSINILDYSDWTEDGSNRPKVATTDFSYGDLRTEAPTECGSEWNSLCRIVINYLDHIQPIWELARVVTDPNDTNIILADNTCTSCHARQKDGVFMIPAGTPPRQLNLTSEQIEGENYYVASYVNLFNGVLRQELLVDSEGNIVAVGNETEPEESAQFFLISQLMLNGVLQYQATDSNNSVVPVPLTNTDPEFTLVLDDAMNPIPFEAYVLDSSGQRILDPSPSGIQYVYLEVQLNISGIPQYQAVNASSELVFAAIDTADPNLTLIRDIDSNPVPYTIFDFDDQNQKQINRIATGNRSPSVLSPAGATASDQFFDVFEAGGTHEGYLNGAELKLIAEWLDIGAQYYNNQFEAPP
ncbi:hypothetical protein SAMN02745866_04023 [Alteromonadaceae bacterium Bs31]|nr:hypothetical protein SAMN02745866_04023 [Alteromonadaceae bacterium Bs31]